MSKTTNLLLSIVLGLTGFLAYAASKFTSGKLVVLITAVGILGFVIAFTVLTFRLKNLKRILKAIVLSLVAVIFSAYLILFVFVYFFEDRVANQTSSFFQPMTISVEKAQALTASVVLPIDLTTPDSVHLRGWLVHNSTESKSPLVIYFGGSGSESSEIIPFARKLDGWSVALINYRGFGLSEGTPTHVNALVDALFIYDTLSTREDIDPNQVVAMGYSLGTGIAVYLSEQRPTLGTVLVSPYDLWTLIGLKQTPLYAPLSGIMKPYFESISRAPGVHTPLLCLIGSEDNIVPPERSEKLVDAWGGETNLISFPGENHSLLFHNNSSWTDILDFLKNLST
jgi:pimeloyl-ACP methyl ester carboxylesterase